MPRKPRRRPRRAEERGLPTREALIVLARTWLENQHKLWPELVASGMLPPLTDDIVHALAEAFETKFLNGDVVPFTRTDELPAGVGVGMAYDRYSSDKSNPASLDQQLLKQLKRARADKVFIPWELVFADAAVTGTTAARHSYILLKNTLLACRDVVGWLYIDEVGRAARDSIEALSLGRMIDNLRKRMIDVSDGFDSTSADARLRLSIFAAIEEHFITVLRGRVGRGRDHAFFKTLTAVKSPAIGYMLVPAVDDKGNAIMGADGEQLNREVVDPETMPYVLLAWHLRGEKHWSRNRLAKLFNEAKVAGRDTWVETSFRLMFKRRDYMGNEIDGRWKKYRHPETGKIIMEERPRKEWRRRKVPEKRVLSLELWKKVRRIEHQCARTYKPNTKGLPKPSRSQVHPKTLFSGVLFCDDCGAEMGLGHSGKHPSFRCFNGLHNRCGCRSGGYKAARIIGNAIFGYLGEQIFTPARIDQVWAEAQAFRAHLLAQPKGNTAPLKIKIRRLESAIDKLMDSVEGESDKNTRRRYHDRIKAREAELFKVETQLREAEQQYQRPEGELTRADVESMLTDLWSLLNKSDPAEVATLLRKLTGPIRVVQRPVPGQKKPVWVAKIKFDLAEALVNLSKGINPTTGILGTLTTRGWTFPIEAEVVLDYPRRYERLAARVKAAVDVYERRHGRRNGATQHAADVLGIPWTEARDALVFAETGLAPPPHQQKRRPPEERNPNRYRRGTTPPYVLIAETVARLRDQQQSWAKISAQVHRSEITCKRAWDHYHRADIEKAAAEGRTLRRGSYSSLGTEVMDRLKEALQPYHGKPLPSTVASQIATTIGCSMRTVQRIRDDAEA